MRQRMYEERTRSLSIGRFEWIHRRHSLDMSTVQRKCLRTCDKPNCRCPSICTRIHVLPFDCESRINSSSDFESFSKTSWVHKTRMDNIKLSLAGGLSRLSQLWAQEIIDLIFCISNVVSSCHFLYSRYLILFTICLLRHVVDRNQLNSSRIRLIRCESKLVRTGERINNQVFQALDVLGGWLESWGIHFRNTGPHQ